MFETFVLSLLNYSQGAMSAVRILRVLRVLRPLRAINRAKGLKVGYRSTFGCCHSLNVRSPRSGGGRPTILSAINSDICLFLACSPMCDSCGKDHRQHSTGYLPPSVHVRGYRSPIIQGRHQQSVVVYEQMHLWVPLQQRPFSQY